MADLRRAFPALRDGAYDRTSPADDTYNCIAWAAGDTTRWWWPDEYGTGYWPPHAPRSESVEAFVAAFASLGYARVDDERVAQAAIFADDAGHPMHAARRLADGRWTSKLGRNIDITHDLRDLEGPAYGRVVVLLGRAP